MQKQTINLTKEEAIKFYNSSEDNGFKELLENTFGKGFAKPKNIYDKIYDLETLTDYIGYNPLIFIGRKLSDREKYLNACSVLDAVVSTYNEGTILDWSNTNQYKYLPYEYWVGGSRSVGFIYWFAYRSASGRSYFKSEELARKAYDNFKEYYEAFWNM